MERKRLIEDEAPVRRRLEEETEEVPRKRLEPELKPGQWHASLLQIERAYQATFGFEIPIRMTYMDALRKVAKQVGRENLKAFVQSQSNKS